MTTGQIKGIVRNRGFGFIRESGAEADLFFHTSALAEGAFDQLSEGQTVEFDREPDPRDAKRIRAVNVRVVGEAN